jgi:hypothetical protein
METMTKEEFLDALDSGAKEVSSAAWRHGRTVTYKLEKDGKPYLATVQLHHEDGIQLFGDVSLRPAKRVMVETWITDPEAP